MAIRRIEGLLHLGERRSLCDLGRFNSFVVEHLLEGDRHPKRHGVSRR